MTAAIGFWPMLFFLLRAYSLGGGTYTGIEAVSNENAAPARAPGDQWEANDALQWPSRSPSPRPHHLRVPARGRAAGGATRS